MAQSKSLSNGTRETVTVGEPARERKTPSIRPPLVSRNDQQELRTRFASFIYILKGGSYETRKLD